MAALLYLYITLSTLFTQELLHVVLVSQALTKPVKKTVWKRPDGEFLFWMYSWENCNEKMK